MSDILPLGLDHLPHSAKLLATVLRLPVSRLYFPFIAEPKGVRHAER
jgi:hypothetical protein